MRTVLRDASYWYEIHGDGEPVVLLHGFTGSTVSWNRFIEAYKDKFKLFVIDLPGHGKTITPSPLSMEQCCQDIHDILLEHGIRTFHLLGYSMGGRTALSYATLYQSQLKSLVLESATPGLELAEEKQSRMEHDEHLALRIEQDGVESFINFWENIPLFESQKKLPEEVRKSIREERLSQTNEGLALSLRCMGTGSQTSWWQSLQEIKVPALLIVGELDQKFIRINNRMKKSLVNSEFIVVQNAGHAIHVERPEFFGKIVEEFVLANQKG